jgi:spastin
MDGVCSGGSGTRVLVLGATNRPFDLDQAALRRLSKRIMIPLPDASTRCQMMRNLFAANLCNLSAHDYDQLAHATQGYSGSDIKTLCQEAALAPIRDVIQRGQTLLTVSETDLRPIVLQDVLASIQIIRPSCSGALLQQLEQWSAL